MASLYKSRLFFRQDRFWLHETTTHVPCLAHNGDIGICVFTNFVFSTSRSVCENFVHIDMVAQELGNSAIKGHTEWWQKRYLNLNTL